MNPNDCQSCYYKTTTKNDWCYWWDVVPTVECKWFKYRRQK